LKPNSRSGGKPAYEGGAMTNNLVSAQDVLGIDVSERRLDVHLLPAEISSSFANDPRGIGRLVAWLGSREGALVVLEATGGLERALLNALERAAMPAAVVNPRQIRDFARSAGLLAKTDRLDARVLALFGQRMRPPPRPSRSAADQRLAGLVLRRRQLVLVRDAERNRRRRVGDAALRRSLDDPLAWLEQEIDRLESLLADQIERSAEGRSRAALLRSVPGIGPVTAASLVALLPELGQLPPKAIASLAGVAPFARDSGAMRGRRTVWGGRQPVRNALYMAVLVAARHNPKIRAFYQHLRERGKAPKLALTACMRKLLVILNALLKAGKPWEARLPA
jgi:transposase